MSEQGELTELVQRVARDATDFLCEAAGSVGGEHEFTESQPREMKALADRLLEKRILSRLSPAGLPILSEESGELEADDADGLRFVVDPIDGTVNFIRGLGPCAVSIALCRGMDPVFGAVGICPGGELAWGGRGVGAFIDKRPIAVSAVADLEQSVLCTGFPTRFRVGDDAGSARFAAALNRFGKVRMLGSAAVSLVKVASGAAEFYLESDIMLWDVAAGLALVEGAGGRVSLQEAGDPHVCHVAAGNGRVESPFVPG